MCEMGGEGLKAAFGMQETGARLGHGPENAQKGGHEGGDADGLVDGKQRRLAGEVIACGIGRVFGDQPERDGAQDQQRSQPVKEFGQAAVAGGSIVKRHGKTLRAAM